VDGLKLQLKEIALREQSVPQFSRPAKHYYNIVDVLDYSYSEMLSGIDFDLPVTCKLIEKLKSD
jgi:hypothetical protein